MLPHKENLCYIGCKISFVTIKLTHFVAKCVLSQFTHFCVEKICQKNSMWGKNDKYEVSLKCGEPNQPRDNVTPIHTLWTNVARGSNVAFGSLRPFQHNPNSCRLLNDYNLTIFGLFECALGLFTVHIPGLTGLPELPKLPGPQKSRAKGQGLFLNKIYFAERFLLRPILT